MLHMAYQENQNLEFAEKYYILVKETADFMADYTVKKKDGIYELLPLYLAGNGFLLPSAAMMAAGYSGCGSPVPN